jgi:hypothetical protein
LPQAAAHVALRTGRAVRQLEIAKAVAAVVEERGYVPRGFYAALARRLKVSRAQICYDVRDIRRAAARSAEAVACAA